MGSAERPPVPDAIEPIVAYRMWTAGPDLVLHSLNGYASWPVGEWMVAACSHGHDAPRERCRCGIYALKHPDSMDMRFAAAFLRSSGIWATVGDSSSVSPPQRPFTVFGKVELAGKVIEHESGYRAERARLVQVLPLGPFRRENELVAQRYGVPVGTEIPMDDPGPRFPVPLSSVGCVYMGTSDPSRRRTDHVSVMGAAHSLVLLVIFAAMFVACLPGAFGILMIENGMNAVLADHHLGWSDWSHIGMVGLGGVILLAYAAILTLVSRRVRPGHGPESASPPLT